MGASVLREEITIGGDGTYTQLVERSDGFLYQSARLSWRMEQRPGGGSYLHLHGMRYCGSTDELCELPEGGGGDNLYYDACEGRMLEMKGEVLLVIYGTAGSANPFLAAAPRGISLMNMSDEGDEANTHFILVGD